MKKFLLTTGLLAASAFPASAQDITFKPYVGLDLQRSVYSYKNEDLGGGTSLDNNKILEDNLDGINMHVGNRFHKYVGAELGYFHTREESRSIAAGSQIGTGLFLPSDSRTKIKTQGFTLDALGYLPVTQDAKLELIGTAGITWTKASFKLDAPGVATESGSESELGLRGGAGAQYNFTNNLNLRGLVRYQTADFDDTTDRAWTVSTGVNYSF